MEEWPEAIRNLLRLDPDTIYYGEARDAESVYGVIEAAQTGHEVLTTTHTTGPLMCFSAGNALVLMRAI